MNRTTLQRLVTTLRSLELRIVASSDGEPSPNTIYTDAYDMVGKRCLTGVRPSSDPVRDHRIGDAAIELYYAAMVRKQIHITPSVLWRQVMGEAWTTPAGPSMKPIDMVLYCPHCGLQHIDRADTDATFARRKQDRPDLKRWTNPPHRTHLCHACGSEWRPADVATNGVKAIKTGGFVPPLRAATMPSPIAPSVDRPAELLSEWAERQIARERARAPSPVETFLSGGYRGEPPTWCTTDAERTAYQIGPSRWP